MSSRVDAEIVTGNRSATRPGPVRAPCRPSDPRDPWLSLPAGTATTQSAASQPGHGRTASLRRQPFRIADGRMEGGYTDLFELVCPSCGDHPYLDYSEVPPRLQRLRGPRTLQAGLAAYEKHLGAGALTDPEHA
jgi:hypothetical protein